MNKAVIVIVGMLVWGIFAAGTGFAAEDAMQIVNLGVDEMISLTLKNSETVQISENNAQKSRSVYHQARAGLLPAVNARASWTHNTEYPISDKTTDYELATGVSASQLLFSFGKVSAAVQAAKSAVEAAKQQKQADVQSIRYIARVSYYSGLLAKNSLTIVEESYKNTLQNKELLLNLSSGGRGSKRDLIKMAADIAARIPVVNSVKTQFISAQQTIRMLTDLPDEAAINLTDGFFKLNPALDADTLAKRMYAQEPSLKALDSTVEANQYTVKSKKADYLPVTSGFASWDYKGESNVKEYVGSENLDDYVAVGVMVNVPLWNGGEKAAVLSQARADMRNAELQRKKTRENLLLALKIAIIQYNEYLITLEANNEAVRLAEESFKMTRDMFQSGQVTLTDLNDAELLLTNQKLQQQQTLYDLSVTYAQIEKLTAGE